MGKELEFKLAAANDAVLDCLLGDPETAARMEGPIVCTPMETTYFDTETNAFRTNHWTLRRRQEGSRSVVCVKTPQPEPFARGEWEVEARAVDDAAIEWLLDFGAPRQLLQLYGEAPLRPVCGARFLRRSVMLRLADGSRVNVVTKPLALDGTSISIRKFSKHKRNLEELSEGGALTKEMVELLSRAVMARLNIVVSGGTGAGKTTLLNALSFKIGQKERVVTIEDAAELQLNQEDIVRLETRPESIEGGGQITQRDLVKNALRMRPDRIILGEVRGGECFDMLQAMNTGHDGSLCTVHANNARDALIRLENMVLMANLQLPLNAIRRQIGGAVNMVVQIERMRDGKRRVVSIVEVCGMEEDVIQTQELYNYRIKSISADGRIVGEFVNTGLRPKFYQDRAHLFGGN